MNAGKLKAKAYDLFVKKKYEKALKYFNEALKADPNDITIQQKIGDTLIRLGKKEEAVKAYKKAAAKYAHRGFLMKAIGVYKLILQIDPHAEDVKELLAELYAERGEEPESRIVVSSETLAETLKKKKEEAEKIAPPPEPETGPKEEQEEKIAVPEDFLKEESATPEVEEQEEEFDFDEEFDIELEEEGDIDSFIKELGLDEEEELPPDEKDHLVEKLPTYPIFSRCSRECFSEIIDRIELKRFDPGEVIIKEGDSGKSFYIIIEGKVEVVKDTEEGKIKLAELGEGSFFGEFAFLSGARRSASVIARTPVELLEFTEELLEDLLRKYPMVAEVLVEFYRERILDTMLAISPLFKHFDPSERKELLKKFEFYEIPAGTVIIREGEEGDGLYVIMFGAVKVTRRDEEGAVHQLAILKEGDFFGEISLLTQGPTTATVTTIERTGVFKLPAAKFQEMIMMYPQILEVTYQYKEMREEQLRDLIADKESLEKTGIV